MDCPVPFVKAFHQLRLHADSAFFQEYKVRLLEDRQTASDSQRTALIVAKERILSFFQVALAVTDRDYLVWVEQCPPATAIIPSFPVNADLLSDAEWRQPLESFGPDLPRLFNAVSRELELFLTEHKASHSVAPKRRCNRSKCRHNDRRCDAWEASNELHDRATAADVALLVVIFAHDKLRTAFAI